MILNILKTKVQMTFSRVLHQFDSFKSLNVLIKGSCFSLHGLLDVCGCLLDVRDGFYGLFNIRGRLHSLLGLFGRLLDARGLLDLNGLCGLCEPL